MKDRLRTLVVWTIAAGGLALAQPPMSIEPMQVVFIEPVTLSSPDSGHVRVDILFRIDRFFFVSVRNTGTSAPWMYTRSGEILLELVDSAGVSAARRLERIETGDDDAEPSLTERKWVEGILSVEVPSGTYHLQFEATDLESKRRFVNKEILVHAVLPPAHHAGVAGALLVASPATVPPDTLIPENFGGDMTFSSSCGLWADVRGIDPSLTSLPARWSLVVMEKRGEHPVPMGADSSATAHLIRGRTLVPLEGAGRYTLVRDTASRSVFAYLPLPTLTLPLRPYVLTAAFGSGHDTTSFTKPVRTVWPDMPPAMKNIDLALDALRFITTEDQLDSLKSGGFEERRDALERFWRSKDKTPGTAMNEVMTEYYRRVDHVMRTFGTLRDPDGTKTDRGRTYILYGPPSHTERTLNPGRGHTEVWTYDHLKRTFTFLDEARNGTYKLVSSSTL